MIQNLKNTVIKYINYNYFVILLLLITIMLLVTKHQIYIVNGHSMEPTLRDHQIVLGNKKVEELKVNDIVVVNIGNNKYIKRIVAVNGITVGCSDKSLTINGIVKPKYYCNGTYKIKLTNNEYFVLGDNAKVSKDSRDFGVIKNKDIEARVEGA